MKVHFLFCFVFLINIGESKTAMVQIPSASFFQGFFGIHAYQQASLSEALHIPVLKHTSVCAENKTKHLSVYVQCVGVSWHSYFVHFSIFFFVCIFKSFQVLAT